MELTQETWHLINNTPKVTGFLGGKTPKPVPAPEMAKALGRTTGAADMPEGVVEEELPSVTYNVGDHVRVKSGPFANFTGEVEDGRLRQAQGQDVGLDLRPPHTGPGRPSPRSSRSQPDELSR